MLKNYIILDSLIFFLSSFILVYYVSKQKNLNFKEKIAFSIFFIILNSSYNIMIKSIHDYNVSIPRTFLYRFKILGPFSILDFVSIFIILKNICFLFKKIFSNKILLLYCVRDFGIYLIGGLSFLIFKGYWIDSGNKFFIVTKGIVYALAALIISMKYLTKSVNLIIPFCIILFGDFLSSVVIPVSDIWIRYGHSVLIIDQEDAYSISILLISFLLIKCFYLKDNEKNKRIISYIMLTLVLFQNIWCMYKTNFIIIPIMIIVMILLFSKNTIKILLYSVISISLLVFSFWNKIKIMITSVAIKTRFVQLNDLIKYVEGKGIYAWCCGIGISTPYYSTAQIGDSGERKEIDMNNNQLLNEWRNEIQTPIISTFKDAGIIGVCYFLVLSFYIVFCIIKEIKKVIKNVKNSYIYLETLSIGIYLIVFSCYQVIMYGGIIPDRIIYVFCVIKFISNVLIINKDGDIDEITNN